MSARPSSWIASQIGYRENYCAARALRRRGALDRLYTDAWVPSGHALLQRAPRKLADLRHRYHPELRDSHVESFLLKLSTLFLSAGRQSHLAFNLAFGEAYDHLVAQHLKQNPPKDPARSGVITFTSGGLETMRVAKSLGLSPVVDQIDPALTEVQIVREEAERWPGWDEKSVVPKDEPDAYWDRVRQEWSEAQWVIVNSDFSRTALIEQGVDPAKLVVIPLAYESPGVLPNPVAKGVRAKLTVLWLGNVIIRKGIQYLRDAALALQKLDIEFLVAGSIGINAERLNDFPSNVRFLGKTSGEPKLELFRNADVFVLPTISDGFAITQIEAVTFGVPVIATPNCGRVVTDGVDGYVIPVRNSEALAQRIETLYKDRDLLRSMSVAAVQKAAQFSIDRYAESLQSNIIRG